MSLLLVLGITGTTPASAQDLGHKAPPQDHTVYINGATIHTVSGDTVERGGIVFADGQITQILDTGMVAAFAPGTKVVEIDAAGLHVYPGLISPYSQLGLTEIQAVRSTQDMAETRPMSPEVRAAVAVNPDSTLLPVTRSNGILLAGVFPTASLRLSGDEPMGLIPGRASLMRLDGWTWEDMAVQQDAGLVINFPLSRPFRAWWMEESEGDQTAGYDRAIAALDAFFDNAVAYHAARDNGDALPTDLRYEAVKAVLPPDGGARRGRAFQPATAPHLLPRQRLRPDHRLAQLRGRARPPPRHRRRPRLAPLPRRGSSRSTPRSSSKPRSACPSVTTPPTTTSTSVPSSSRPRACSTASWPATTPPTSGTSTTPRLWPSPTACPPTTRLHALTLGAAEIFGVADTFGSLEIGKSATLIVTSGHPLDVLSNVELAFIDGRAIDLENKQTKLAAKYREKYQQLGIITDE
ncbi:MAG: hypothetical protein HND58_18910 [Planctomycetota bacterium]|nr:MAG: hypothetical protein HND58_18910 [Planctomycetota bacterium]